jgi:hypothetical protein
LQLIHASRPAALALLLALCPVPALATPTNVAPQAVTRDNRAAEEVAGQPFIDRKVGSVMERFSRWKARMKKEHFTEYLTAYAAIAGTLTGAIFGFLAYRFGDPMSPYRRSRKQTLLLAIAIGAGLGVFVAVTQVPPNIPGKVTILLRALAVTTFTTTTVTLLLFVLQRMRTVRKARRAGIEITGRLRLP